MTCCGSGEGAWPAVEGMVCCGSGEGAWSAVGQVRGQGLLGAWSAMALIASQVAFCESFQFSH